MKLLRRGEQVEGSLSITPHHLVFSSIPQGTAQGQKGGIKGQELWITYPIIQKCTLRPAPTSSRLPSYIRLQCRDFSFICFCFVEQKTARDVYDSIQAWTCKLGNTEKLYAFSYQPQKTEKSSNAWNLFDVEREFQRQGLQNKGLDQGWRMTNLNADYKVCRSGRALFP